MFSMLRKMILPGVLITLLFFVALIVLEWGLDFSGRAQMAQANVAGSINGREVSWQQYQLIYNNLYQTEAQRYNYDVPEFRIQQIEQQAWDQIVANELIEQEAERLNVYVTDDEVFYYLAYSPPQYLQSAEVFQTNGQFDYSKYQGLMADPQYAPMWKQLEPQIRQEIRMMKVQQSLIDAALVSEEEVRWSFIESSEQIKVTALRAPFSSYQGSVTEISEEQKRAYFDGHREDYKVNERVRVEVVKVSKDPSATDTLRAQRQAREIYDSAMAGADFAELARTWSADPGSAEKGGDLDWFKRGQMVKAFDSAAFAMADGELSPPIQTQFGYHILKKHGSRTENDVEEVHASHVLIEISTSPETIEEAAVRLGSLLESAVERDLVEVANEMELEVESPAPINQYQMIPGLGQTQEAVKWAFGAEPGDISSLLETSSHTYVVRLIEKLPEGLAEYEEVELQVERDTRDDLLRRMCADTIQVAYDKILAGATAADVAAEHSLPYDTLGPFSRSATVGAVLSDPKVIGTAFGLEQDQMSEPIEFESGSVILKLIERTDADLTQFNQSRDSIYQTLLANKQQQLYNNWFTLRQKESEIFSNIGRVRTAQ